MKPRAEGEAAIPKDMHLEIIAEMILDFQGCVEVLMSIADKHAHVFDRTVSPIALARGRYTVFVFRHRSPVVGILILGLATRIHFGWDPMACRAARIAPDRLASSVKAA
jgi:hypothetical protein